MDELAEFGAVVLVVAGGVLLALVASKLSGIGRRASEHRGDGRPTVDDGWMLGQLSTVYFQAYKVAFDAAQQAERAFRFERAGFVAEAYLAASANGYSDSRLPLPPSVNRIWIWYVRPVRCSTSLSMKK